MPERATPIALHLLLFDLGFTLPRSLADIRPSI
jgi:hypothetical protein